MLKSTLLPLHWELNFLKETNRNLHREANRSCKTLQRGAGLSWIWTLALTAAPLPSAAQAWVKQNPWPARD